MIYKYYLILLFTLFSQCIVEKPYLKDDPDGLKDIYDDELNYFLDQAGQKIVESKLSLQKQITANILFTYDSNINQLSCSNYIQQYAKEGEKERFVEGIILSKMKRAGIIQNEKEANIKIHIHVITFGQYACFWDSLFIPVFSSVAYTVDTIYRLEIKGKKEKVRRFPHHQGGILLVLPFAVTNLKHSVSFSSERMEAYAYYLVNTLVKEFEP